MYRRIDPTLPVVWRDQTTVQIGVDPVIAVIPIDTEPLARAIVELIRGTNDRTILHLLGTPDALRSLWNRLGSALIPRAAPDSPRWLLVGTVPALSTLTEALTHTATLSTQPGSWHSEGVQPDLVVLVSHFVVQPSDVQPWLARDIPHVPIVFGESSVTIGPLVVPGHTPCIRCRELERIDADPAWAAIAPQLWRRSAASDTPTLSVHAAAELLRLVQSGGGHSTRIDASTLERLTMPHSFHPECGCVTLPE